MTLRDGKLLITPREEEMQISKLYTRNNDFI